MIKGAIDVIITIISFIVTLEFLIIGVHTLIL